MKEDCLRKIQQRQSIRRYSADPIPESDIDEILRTGFSAPSAGNRQPWRVILITRQDLKNKLALAAGGQAFLAQAPIILVVCAVPQESAERYAERGLTLYALQDTAALTENLLLAIHVLDYASCWIGAFNESQVADILNIPKGIRPVAIIPIGKQLGQSPPKPKRRPNTDTVVKETY